MGFHGLQQGYLHLYLLPRVGFETTITASERAKTGHALDRSATVTGKYCMVSDICKDNYQYTGVILTPNIIWVTLLDESFMLTYSLRRVGIYVLI
jgi:hypothetical protein